MHSHLSHAISVLKWFKIIHNVNAKMMSKWLKSCLNVQLFILRNGWFVYILVNKEMRMLYFKAHAVLVDKLQFSQTNSVCYSQIRFISETGERTPCELRGSVSVVETGTSQRKVDNVKSMLDTHTAAISQLQGTDGSEYTDHMSLHHNIGNTRFPSYPVQIQIIGSN